MSAPTEMNLQGRFLGLTADQFITTFKSLADVRSHIDLVIERPVDFGISLKNADRAVAWLADFRGYKFEEEQLNVFAQTKYYQYCGITIPVHSPVESLAYTMSLVEPPDDAIEKNWYEVWAVCIARLIGTISPEQAPVTLSLLYPSPRFKLPRSWDSKYLVGTSISMRLIDHLGQLIPNRQEAGERREIVRSERCQFAVRCGAVVPRSFSIEPSFQSKNAFQQLIGLCAQHMPSCVILKTVPAKNASNFKRLAVSVDMVANTQNVSIEQDDYWRSFFKDTCINCVDGHCNPAGFAAARRGKPKVYSG